MLVLVNFQTLHGALSYCADFYLCSFRLYQMLQLYRRVVVDDRRLYLQMVRHFRE